MKIKITKSRFLLYYSAVVAFLFLVKCVFPSVAEDRDPVTESQGTVAQTEKNEGVTQENSNETKSKPKPFGRFFNKDGSLAKHRIYSVSSYEECFPDSQATQIEAALKFGVEQVLDRADAESKKDELVYVGANPYYVVEELTYSIPYLVPKAATLLQDIGKAFADSLQIKDIEPYRLVITSVLRSADDVERLRLRNFNATENSCHQYGTTVDISYTKFRKVEAVGKQTELRDCPSDKLKWILSEVLRDFRESGRCFIKHENKQACFHLTVCK